MLNQTLCGCALEVLERVSGGKVPLSGAAKKAMWGWQVTRASRITWALLWRHVREGSPDGGKEWANSWSQGSKEKWSGRILGMWHRTFGIVKYQTSRAAVCSSNLKECILTEPSGEHKVNRACQVSLHFLPGSPSCFRILPVQDEVLSSPGKPVILSNHHSLSLQCNCSRINWLYMWGLMSRLSPVSMDLVLFSIALLCLLLGQHHTVDALWWVLKSERANPLTLSFFKIVLVFRGPMDVFSLVMVS